MKFALVGGHRKEAQPGLSGECPNCRSSMVAKCGDIRVWHWAHLGRRTCDHWWENETEWHRTWKNRFPSEWQEIVHRDESGEKHIADVKTKDGRVIEYQHSYLRSEERQARETFYRPMYWVVDGLRRSRDRQKFLDALSRAKIFVGKPLTLSIPEVEGALLRDWADSRVPVFFDFGEINDLEEAFGFRTPVLWCLDPNGTQGWRHLVPIQRDNFAAAFIERLPLKAWDCSKQLERVQRNTAQVNFRSGPRGPLRATGFQQYLARKRRAQSRRRF